MSTIVAKLMWFRERLDKSKRLYSNHEVLELVERYLFIIMMAIFFYLWYCMGLTGRSIQMLSNFFFFLQYAFLLFNISLCATLKLNILLKIVGNVLFLIYKLTTLSLTHSHMHTQTPLATSNAILMNWLN